MAPPPVIQWPSSTDHSLEQNYHKSKPMPAVLAQRIYWQSLQRSLPAQSQQQLSFPTIPLKRQYNSCDDGLLHPVAPMLLNRPVPSVIPTLAALQATPTPIQQMDYCCYDEPHPLSSMLSTTTAANQQQILRNNNSISNSAVVVATVSRHRQFKIEDDLLNQQQEGEKENEPRKNTHLRELDLLKQKLAESEEQRKKAQQEVEQLTRQLEIMRFAQAELVNGQKLTDKVLADERKALEKKNNELVEEKVALGKQCRQLKVANTHLQVEMDCLRRSRQSAENGEDNGQGAENWTLTKKMEENKEELLVPHPAEQQQQQECWK